MSTNQPQPPTSQSTQSLSSPAQPAPVLTASPAPSIGPIAQQSPPQQRASKQLAGQQTPTPPPLKKSTWTGFANKTFWDWLQLLLIPVLLPALLFCGGIWFQAQQHDSDQSIAKANRDKDIQIATDQQQATTLNAYFDDMTDLMLNKGLRQSKADDEVRVVARAKTLTALRVLNGDRKGTLIRFLYEAKLIGGQQQKAGLRYDAIVGLDGADLSGASLNGADLHGVILSLTNLQRASLVEAILSGASLYQADLQGANLQGTYLDGADLQEAKVTKEQLASAYRLKFATLPDGSAYPSQSYPISNHTEP